MWVVRQSRKRRHNYDSYLCKTRAIAAIVMPFADWWRFPQLFGQNVFKNCDVEHMDDTGTVLGMLCLMMFASSCQCRSSYSWIIATAGSMSYSILAIMTGTLPSDPLKRSRTFRDIVFVIAIDLFLVGTWLNGLEKERYLRCNFLASQSTAQMRKVLEKSLKGYVDACVILSDGRIVASTPVLDAALGMEATNARITDFLVEEGKQRFDDFLAEIQRVKDCQKISISCNTSAGGAWEVEVFGV